MEFQWKTYDIEWIKDGLSIYGLLLIAAAIVLAIVTPLVKIGEQRGNIETYYMQAVQAATPSQFTVALRELDRALDNAGMVSGNTKLFIYGHHDDMAFKRARFLSLADRAETLIELPISSTEVGIGLADLRIALREIDLRVYGFWFLQQGGSWLQLYIPVILIVLGAVASIVADALPCTFERRVRVRNTPA